MFPYHISVQDHNHWRLWYNAWAWILLSFLLLEREFKLKI